MPVAPWLQGVYVIVKHLQLTIGPLNLIYYRRAGGTLVAYHPRGILVPTRCPRGGFPFALSLGFADGTGATATSSVPCPTRKPTRHQQ
ncbi:MAG: hypothetical protein ACHQC8_03230 [Solirubrobacterales bacterium]